MNDKVFVALSTFAQCGSEPLDLLKRSGLPYTINPLGRRLIEKEIVELGWGCRGIIAGAEPYSEQVLEKLKNLQCISRCGVGMDNIALGKAKQQGIEIRNTPDVVAQPVAELTVGLIFDLLKKITWHSIHVKSGNWQKQAGTLFQGKKVGIIGLGRTGRRTAEMIRALGAQVCGSDPFPQKDWAMKHKIEIIPTKELLKISDIVSLHLSQKENHPFQMGNEEFLSMKLGSYFINLSRGQSVNEESLYTTLKSGHLAGAALDVYTKEPYHGPLCDLDNVILTPHIATFTKESRYQMEIEATQNLLNCLQCRKVQR